MNAAFGIISVHVAYSVYNWIYWAINIEFSSPFYNRFEPFVENAICKGFLLGPSLTHASLMEFSQNFKTQILECLIPFGKNYKCAFLEEVGQ